MTINQIDLSYFYNFCINKKVAIQHAHQGNEKIMANRIKAGMSLDEIVRRLAGDDPLAKEALLECRLHLTNGDFHTFCQVSVDGKRLYGKQIGQLYEVCHHNPWRFIYHADIELPDQKTGEWSMLLVRFPSCDSDSFRQARMSTRVDLEQNPFWALRYPPINTDYDFPIYQER